MESNGSSNYYTYLWLTLSLNFVSIYFIYHTLSLSEVYTKSYQQCCRLYFSCSSALHHFFQRACINIRPSSFPCDSLLTKCTPVPFCSVLFIYCRVLFRLPAFSLFSASVPLVRNYALLFLISHGTLCMHEVFCSCLHCRCRTTLFEFCFESSFHLQHCIICYI